MTSPGRVLPGCILVAVGSLIALTAFAGGDEDHKPVARVSGMLAADTDNLTPYDIASEVTSADRYRDSDRNGAKKRCTAIRQWHFVDDGGFAVLRDFIKQGCTIEYGHIGRQSANLDLTEKR